MYVCVSCAQLCTQNGNDLPEQLNQCDVGCSIFWHDGEGQVGGEVLEFEETRHRGLCVCVCVRVCV